MQQQHHNSMITHFRINTLLSHSCVNKLLMVQKLLLSYWPVQHKQTFKHELTLITVDPIYVLAKITFGVRRVPTFDFCWWDRWGDLRWWRWWRPPLAEEDSGGHGLRAAGGFARSSAVLVVGQVGLGVWGGFWRAAVLREFVRLLYSHGLLFGALFLLLDLLLLL